MEAMVHTLSKTIALVVFMLSCAVLVHASPLGQTYTLHSIQSFTELLIERGIVPGNVAPKAREYARMLSLSDSGDVDTRKGALNANKVEVSVSQLIDNANLVFERGDDIKGPLLMVKNISAETVTLEAKRNCQIIYRLYTETDTLVYDSASSKVCKEATQITYALDAGKTRMFPVRHPKTEYALTRGTYRLEIEYPGYGKGERSITVQ
jgi:hypothetical protein